MAQKWLDWSKKEFTGGVCGGTCAPVAPYLKEGYDGMAYGRECIAARAYKKPATDLPEPAWNYKRDDFHDCNVYCTIGKRKGTGNFRDCGFTVIWQMPLVSALAYDVAYRLGFVEMPLGFLIAA
ncbi:hypothetical protein FKW77_008405 [Venturia effusa]|uniref:Uncharacterized protein n=1 Tax=Venturia effusa TaxID=50376 RepID=A0A517L5Y3_9PEZI|nr:hypothetical protein FKW77_008405 [Venturia effusa]